MEIPGSDLPVGQMIRSMICRMQGKYAILCGPQCAPDSVANVNSSSVNTGTRHRILVMRLHTVFSLYLEAFSL